MKKTIIILLTALCCLASCTNDIWDSINELNTKVKDLDGRVTRLEELCKEMNTNISSLQTIVSVMLNNDYILSVTPIIKENVEIGYVITFAIHEPITIYHGQNGQDGEDGKDGQNGQDGIDGHTPIIGVAKDSDGIYYWTLDGDWLLDANGNKLRVTGADGQDGQNGTNGTNGVTPQLKIEDDYWYISYDNGATWTQLGKAKGDKGDNGTNGTDGQDGDSMFQSVTQDENYVYFTLTNGEIIKVAKTPNNSTEGGASIVNGAIQAPFSVSATKQVYFSQGNLQYQASTGTWRFAEHQYDRIGEGNINISATYDGWIDLFGWGTSGWNSGAVAYQPYSTSTTNSDYYPGGSYMNNLTGTYANADWGVYNAISNGGNQAGQWRTLTKDEWDYLLNTRTDADVLKAHALINYVPGLLLFPDNYNFPWGLYVKRNDAAFSCNNYDIYHWRLLEQAGAVFLPACGGLAVEVYLSDNAYYWSSTAVDADKVWDMLFSDENMAVVHKHPRSNGRSVRLVKDVE